MIRNRRGSGMLLILIMLAVVSLLITSLLKTVTMQLDVSSAQAEAKKARLFVDQIIKVCIVELNETLIVEREEILDELTKELQQAFENEEDVLFETERGFYIDDDWVRCWLMRKSYETIREVFYEEIDGLAYKGKIRPKMISYSTGGIDEEIVVNITPYIKGINYEKPSNIDEDLLLDYNKIQESYEDEVYSIALHVSAYLRRHGEVNKAYEESLVAYLKFSEGEPVTHKVYEKYSWTEDEQRDSYPALTCGGDLQINGEMDILGSSDIDKLTIEDGARINIWDSSEPENRFEEVSLEQLSESLEWAEEAAIKVVREGRFEQEVEVTQFYNEEEPVTSLIVSESPLRVTGEKGQVFKGMIVANDNIYLEGDINVDGAIVSTKDIQVTENTYVRVNGQVDRLLEVGTNDLVTYRAVMDGLSFMDTTKESLEEVLGAHDERSLSLHPDIDIEIISDIYLLKGGFVLSSK